MLHSAVLVVGLLLLVQICADRVEIGRAVCVRLKPRGVRRHDFQSKPSMGKMSRGSRCSTRSQLGIHAGRYRSHIPYPQCWNYAMSVAVIAWRNENMKLARLLL